MKLYSVLTAGDSFRVIKKPMGLHITYPHPEVILIQVRQVILGKHSIILFQNSSQEILLFSWMELTQKIIPDFPI